MSPIVSTPTAAFTSPTGSNRSTVAAEWTRRCRGFLRCHRRPINVALHLFTTPLGLFGVYAIVAGLSPFAVAPIAVAPIAVAPIAVALVAVALVAVALVATVQIAVVVTLVPAGSAGIHAVAVWRCGFVAGPIWPMSRLRCC